MTQPENSTKPPPVDNLSNQGSAIFVPKPTTRSQELAAFWRAKFQEEQRIKKAKAEGTFSETDAWLEKWRAGAQSQTPPSQPEDGARGLAHRHRVKQHSGVRARITKSRWN